MRSDGRKACISVQRGRKLTLKLLAAKLQVAHLLAEQYRSEDGSLIIGTELVDVRQA